MFLQELQPALEYVALSTGRGDLPFHEEVYVGTWEDCALVDHLLVQNGIPTLVGTDARSSRFTRAIYVLDPDYVDLARHIVDRFVNKEPLEDPKSYRSWRCRSCNELVEGQFEACWNCGGTRI